MSGVSEAMASLTILGVSLLVAWGLPKVPGLRGLDPTADHGGRVASIDGLRGYLAMGVVLSHAACFHQWYETGHWDYPPHQMLRLSGQVGVALFFAITGYLFWGQALAGKVVMRRLYERRLWRIYPLYLALIAVALVLATAIRSHGEGLGQMLRLSVKMLIPGLVLFPQDIPDTGLMAGQTWTLKYEMLFYLALPFLAPVARKVWSSLALILVALAIRVVAPYGGIPLDVSTYVAFFAVGALVAQIKASGRDISWASSRTAGLVSVLGVIGLFLLPSVFDGRFVPLVFLAFAPVALGNDWFGLLTWSPSRMLGDVSYSVYMWHLVALFVGLRFLNGRVPVAGLPAVVYWVFIALLSALIVGTSLVSYHFLERPFLKGRPRPAKGTSWV